MPPCLFRRWQFTIHLIIIILVNMSLFRYFGREKVKAVGDNNNLEATKKDDDQSNATGVAKSTAELGEAQESSRKRCRTFRESWKTRRPWLKFDEKENAMFCSYCRQFSKDKSAFDFYNTNTNGQKQRDTGWSKHFIKILLNTDHCICISFSCSN